MDPFVHSLTEEVERDVLTILFEADSPMRFTEILSELVSQSMYRGKAESLRVILSRILNRLKDEGLLRRKSVSHKNVQYSVRDRRKVKLRLGLKPDVPKQVFSEIVRSIGSCKLEDMTSNFLSSYLLFLVDYERLMCKALAQMDEESFRFFRRHGRTDMLLLWDVFADSLWEKRKEAKKVYETKFRELDELSMETGFVTRTKDGWIINLDAYIEHQQVLNDVELKHIMLIVSTLQNVLNIFGKHLELRRQLKSNPKMMREETVKLFEEMGRSLTYGELKQLKKLMLEEKK